MPDPKATSPPVHYRLVIKTLLSSLRRALHSGASVAAVSVAAPALVAASAGTGFLVAAAAVDIPAAASGKPAQRVLLLPMGTIKLRDGRGPYQLTDLAHAQAVVAASLARAGGADIVIDYDHQTFYGAGPGNGGTAIAAGWIKALTADAAGIWADIEWTVAASAKLADREYRYISPLFAPAQDGRVLLLANAGLVNVPAITDLPAVAAADLPPNHSELLNMEKIAAALGLPAMATLDDILAAIGKMAMPEATGANMQACAAALGLATDAKLDAVLIAAATAASAQPDPAKFAPIAEVAALTTQLGAINAERADAFVAAAAAQGKMIPAQAARIKRMFLNDEADARDWIATAPVIVAPGAMPGFEAAGALNGDGLTAYEAKVSKSLGLTPEQFIAAKKPA